MVEEAPGGCVLQIRVIPRARRTAIAGTRQDSLLVRLAAPPVDGTANAALVSFLSEQLDVPMRAVRIVSGETRRDKRVSIEGLSAADARSRLRLERG